jgi:hypothetical protein
VTRQAAAWRGRSRRIAATAIAGLTIAAVVISLLLWIARGMADLPVSFGRTPVGVLGLVLSPVFYAAMGGILAGRLPGNPIGWLFLVMGASLGMMLPVNLLVAGAHESLEAASPAVVWAAWTRTTFGTPVVLAAAVIAVQLFPDGRAVSRRWRAGLWLGGVSGSLLLAATAFDPVGLVTYPSIPNPLALPYGTRDLLIALRSAAVAGLLLSAVIAIASLWLRYQRGDPILRAQLRWILLAVVLTVLTAVPFVIARYVLRVTDATGEMLSAVAQIGSCAFPLAAAFAISRYRLFDIDVVIGRTLVYLPMMAVLGGLYTAGIALFQRIFVAVTGSESDAAIVLTILVVATVFTPLRRSLEALVHRRFAGSEVDVPTTNARPTTELPAAVAEGVRLDGGSPLPTMHVAQVRADDGVDCPLRPQCTLRDCVRCRYLRAIGDGPELTIVCAPPAVS